MTLVKWTPKSNMLNFFDDVDRMIGQAFSRPLETEHESDLFSPLMNVNESDLEYTVSMDLPGVDKKDVEVNMSEGMVTVIGERKNSQQGKNTSCIWTTHAVVARLRNCRAPTAPAETAGTTFCDFNSTTATARATLWS